MNFATGIACFRQGITLARSREALPYIAAPALVSVLIIGAGLGLGFSYVDDLSTYLQDLLPDWLDFLHLVVAPLLYLLGILIGAWLFGLVAAIIGSPFLGDLAAHTTKTISDRQVINDRPWWQEIAPSLLRELRKLGYHIPRLMLVVILSIIPVLNTLSPIVWLMFGAWMMSVQFCDYFSENADQPFRQTLSQLREQRGAALGFGMCVSLTMGIPVLNFLVAPIAVIGGTILMHRINHDVKSLQEHT